MSNFLLLHKYVNMSTLNNNNNKNKNQQFYLKTEKGKEIDIWQTQKFKNGASDVYRTHHYNTEVLHIRPVWRVSCHIEDI